MRTVGYLVNGKSAQQAEQTKPKGGRPNKAALLEECTALGIVAPEGATNPELQELIAAAKAEQIEQAEEEPEGE